MSIVDKLRQSYSEYYSEDAVARRVWEREHPCEAEFLGKIMPAVEAAAAAGREEARITDWNWLRTNAARMSEILRVCASHGLRAQLGTLGCSLRISGWA